MNKLFRFSSVSTRLFFFLSSFAVLAACDEEPECTGNSQCALDQICQASRCVPRPTTINRAVYCDGGTEICAPDAANSETPPDTGVSDSGTMSSSDSGSTAADGSNGSSVDGSSGSSTDGSTGSADGSTSQNTDGGPGSSRWDVGPLPIIDGGPGYDSGLSPPLTLDSTGHVWISEFSDFADTGAYLFDRSGGNYSETVQTFAVTSGSCRVRSRRALSGSPTGIPADSIRIDYSLSPHVPGPAVLTSANNDGYFRPTAPLPMPPVFTGNSQVRFQLVEARSQSSSVPNLEVLVDPPPVPAITAPSQGTSTFSISGNPLISWNKGFGSANRTIYIELADFARDTILTCEVDDTARQLRIPAAAIRAWSLEGPAAPAQLEIRYDNRETRTVVTNTGLPVQVTFRTSAGRSFALVP
ncbi:MAG: hypothetical protein VYC39_02445 [Myxococcota bacterium]|nr:hypothetical protein [Myxococcota bacterium]